MKHIFSLSIPVPHSTVNIYIGCTSQEAIKDSKRSSDEYKELIKLLERDFDELNNGISDGFCHKSNGLYLIALQKFENTWYYFDVLNHEITHLVEYILGDRGADNESEFRAYLHQFIFKSIREELYRKFPSDTALDTSYLPPICPQVERK